MEDTLSYKVIGCIFEVYHTLGPGLLESVYESALMHELRSRGIQAKNQVDIDVEYKNILIPGGFRVDILVDDQLVIELKSVDQLKPIHFKQLTTYLKLAHKRVGLLVNFNEADIQKGIRRVVND